MKLWKNLFEIAAHSFPILMKEASYKAKKGLIRVRLETVDENIEDIEISGDFFMYPEDHLWKLEELLLGKRIDERHLFTEISGFYERFDVESPGVTPEDFVKVIMKASKA